MTDDVAIARRAAIQNDRIARLDRMIEIRAFEDRVRDLFAEGKVHGSTHLAQGQEAVAVGLASALRVSDTVTCTYRGHGVALALGLEPEPVLGEIMGRTAGTMAGLGGSMHLSGRRVGLLPTFAIVGAGIPVAAGAALTAQVRGTDDVGVAVFGDGAANIGAFHEALNLAAIWQLPALFVIENNVYGEYSRYHLTTPIKDLAPRGDAYAIPWRIVDGQDVDEVVWSVGEAVADIRSGQGPRLLELKTYRYAGHSRSDPAEYRPAGEFDAWLERDPIDRFRGRLLAEGRLSPADAERMESDVAERIDAALRTVEDSPAPEPAAMFGHVWANPLREAAALGGADA